MHSAQAAGWLEAGSTIAHTLRARTLGDCGRAPPLRTEHGEVTKGRKVAGDRGIHQAAGAVASALVRHVRPLKGGCPGREQARLRPRGPLKGVA